MRSNYVIKLYTVRLVHYFGGRHRTIRVMGLSIMIQQRVIVNDALRCHLSPSTRRLGAWGIGIPLPRPPICHSSPSSFPPCVPVTSHYSINGQPRSQ